jgi:cell division protease FtsH
MKKEKKLNIYWIYFVLVAVLIGISILDFDNKIEKISWNQLETLAESKAIKSLVIVNKKTVKVVLNTPPFSPAAQEVIGEHNKDVKALKISAVLPQEDFIKDLILWGKEYHFSVDFSEEQNRVWDLFAWSFPFVLFAGFWIFMMRRMSGGGPGGIFSFGKSRAKLTDGEESHKITFNDVAGLAGAKEEVQEIVEFLKNPLKFTNLGAKIPKGALLIGAPGTGKTLLAKAVAGEAGVPFFSLSGSDFVEMFVGVGASRVRDLFKQAKEKAPCIIFIDEIDAIGKARSKAGSFSTNDERENTLNQLLTEMDGFGTNTGVIVLAATNRVEILDKALLRPGRFDRQIFIDLPDLSERKDIFAVHLKPLKLGDDIDVDFLSRQTPGFSGADIANLCNEAALIGARRNHEHIIKQDFLDAVDRIIGGLEKKNKLITLQEKRTIAFHEAGHAVVSWFLKSAAPLVKVTIVPRGQSLGAAWYLPEERLITTKEQMLEQICATMGGRAAEKIVFNEISTGALSDLQVVNKTARAMVTIYGLNDKLGNLSYYDPTTDTMFSKPYSEQTAHVIDQEISLIIEQAYQRALQILEKHKDKLHQLATVLLEKEVIFKEDLELLFGKRPFDIPVPTVEKPTSTLGELEVTLSITEEKKTE